MYVVEVGPQVEPLTLEQVKLHLKVEEDADDTLIENLIVAVREKTENYLNRKLVSQTIHQYFDSFDSFLKLSVAPVIEVLNIEYATETEDNKVLTADQFQLDDILEPCKIYPSAGGSFPEIKAGVINPIRVAYNAGYGTTADAIPKSIQLGMLLMCGDFYENRNDSVRTLPQASKNILFHYRVLSL